MKVLVLVAVLAGVSQAPELKFAWPDNLTAIVEAERRREQKQGAAAPKVTELKVRYRMRALPHPRGRLIQYDEYRILDDSIDTRTGDEVGQALSALIPNLVVSPNGELVGIANIDALRQAMDEIMAPLKKESAKAPPEVQQMLAALTSEPFLNAVAGQEWQGLVQAWVGLPVSAEVTRFESEQPFPLLQGMTVTLRGTARMLSQQECVRGGITLACATFEMTSSTDPKVIEDLMKRLFQGDKDFQGVKFDRLEITNTLRVTMETATMVPHAWSLNKSVIMVASDAKGERMEATQKESRTTKYSYATPRAAR